MDKNVFTTGLFITSYYTGNWLKHVHVLRSKPSDCRAFYVPARSSSAPRRFPVWFLRFGTLPQGKIPLVSFIWAAWRTVPVISVCNKCMSEWGRQKRQSILLLLCSYYFETTNTKWLKWRETLTRFSLSVHSSHKLAITITNGPNVKIHIACRQGKSQMLSGCSC